MDKRTPKTGNVEIRDTEFDFCIDHRKTPKEIAMEIYSSVKKTSPLLVPKIEQAIAAERAEIEKWKEAVEGALAARELVIDECDQLREEIDAKRAEVDKIRQDMHLAVSNAGKSLIVERDQLREENALLKERLGPAGWNLLVTLKTTAQNALHKMQLIGEENSRLREEANEIKDQAKQVYEDAGRVVSELREENAMLKKELEALKAD